MPSSFHLHPDGLLYIRTDAGNYADTPKNFELDFGEELPPTPDGVERIYDQGRRHPLMKNGDVIDAGPLPWEFGDRAISSLPFLLSAQMSRRDTDDI